jgi:hypothetical protein
MVGTDIGYFGDARLEKVGKLLVDRVARRQAVSIRKLGDDRAQHARFLRFLHNPAVTVDEMIAHRASLAGRAAIGRHVLAIQDTSEIKYQAQCGRKRRLGKVGNGTDVGLFVHPVLTVDAQTEQCLGLAHLKVWCRKRRKAANYKRLPIERKESYRWVDAAEQAKAALTQASMITIIDDREGDIYEKWARLPDAHTHLLTRASRNRSLVGGGSLFPTLASFPEAHRYTLSLPARPGKRSARKACIAVRFGPIRVRRSTCCTDPDAPAEIQLFAVEAREVGAPAGEEPICWRLVTTHKVETVEQAMQIIGWYRMRWHIEQLFRTAKSQGLGIEQSVIEDGVALKKLATVAVIGACITMQLVLSRSDEGQDAPAERIFDDTQIEVLHALQAKLQGRTAKQKNPYRPDTLAWAAWTIARLGGWTGYETDRSMGPLTMRDGLERFSSIVDGYHLFKNVC